MKKSIPDIIFKVIMLTWVFFVIINYFWYLLNADNESTNSQNRNIETFKSNDIEEIGSIWVAISTNIWTRYKEMKDTPVKVFKDVIDIWYVLWNQNIAKDKIITVNMVALNEYFNVLKTDIRWLIWTSNDRELTLNAFIAQLEYRYKNWNENQKNLILQRTELLKAYDNSNSEIERLKTKISWDFWNFDNTETIKNIDEYLKVRQENLNARTYIVFINKFINSYQILNEYNKKVLDTLINNKEIIIKNSQLVIPNTWTELLKELKLMYSEDEWKSR